MTCNCGKVSDGASDMELENDYSEESSRLASFTNFFRSTCPVSAPALARAGFYYTGIEDRVECFSCKAVVEGWQHGDTAIGKHRKVSPNCKFINAFTARSESIQTQAPISQNSAPHLVNNGANYDIGQTSNSDIQSDFLLRTGRIVDESEPKFPRYINMCTEEARLETFKNWPTYVRVTPRELASAGLFFTGINDQVKCFCCGGKLMNWEPSDVAWTEHRKHFPDCLFVLGRDVGNVEGSEIPENPAMSQVKSRLESFANWPYAGNKEMLAGAGFYSTGEHDSARCFYCGGELRDWKGKDDPWELHARWYPGCKFLIDEKGQHFINHVQLSRPLSSKPESDTPTALPEDTELVKDPLVIHAQQMGFDIEEIKKLMLKRLKNTGQNYTSVEVLVSDLLNSQSATRSLMPTENENTIKEKLRQLEEEKICKVCMDKSVCIVFIPCGHLVTCADCGEALDKCPICCTIIERRQKIFMS